MRRTALALSVVAIVGAAGPALAADPGAEVSPSTVRAGGNVTVSVTCEAIGGTVAETIDATSQGFDDGTVQLQRVPGNDDRAAGAAYRGTARISDGEGAGRTPRGPSTGPAPRRPADRAGRGARPSASSAGAGRRRVRSLAGMPVVMCPPRSSVGSRPGRAVPSPTPFRLWSPVVC